MPTDLDLPALRRKAEAALSIDDLALLPDFTPAVALALITAAEDRVEQITAYIWLVRNDWSAAGYEDQVYACDYLIERIQRGEPFKGGSDG